MVFRIVGTTEKEPSVSPKRFRIVGREEVPPVSPKAKKIARGFRFYGAEPFSPEAIAGARRKAGITLKEALGGAAGLPGDILQLLQRIGGIKEPVEILPTGERVRSIFEKLAGEEFRPETRFEELLGRGAGMFGALALPIGGQAQLGRALTGAALGTGAEAMAEEAGLPKGFQTAASIAGSLIPFLTRRGVPPPTRAAEIARREAIKAPAAAVAKKVPIKKLRIAKPTRLVEKRKIAFEKSVEKAKDRILESVTPLAKTEKEAANLKKAASTLFDAAETKAAAIKGPAFTSNLEKSLSKNIRRLAETPALSTEEKSTLKFLTEVSEGLEAKNTVSNLMALNKSLDKEINFLKITSGDRALLDVKNALMKDISNAGKFNPQFFKEWKTANANYSEFKRFTKIRETLDPIFKEDAIDFRKFKNLFTDAKKQKELTRLFGKDQYQRLREISKLSKSSSEIFKELSKDPRFFRQLERFNNFGLIMSFVTGRFKAFGFLLAEKAVVSAGRGYLGRLFTDPTYQRHYSNLLKAVKKANQRGILLAAKKVNDDINDTKKDIKD